MIFYHPAKRWAFRRLLGRLQEEVAAGNVREVQGVEGLHLYCYTEKCVYERAWNEINMLTRGLILDVEAEEVVATPFPKFFNVAEVGMERVPNIPFAAYEKMDGSLIIMYWWRGGWHYATKGSFTSEQSKWAAEWARIQGLGAWKIMERPVFEPGATYLWEAIYPANRIVVNYGARSELVLLGGYSVVGREYAYDELWCALTGKVTVVPREEFKDVAEMLAAAGRLEGNKEGWVLRFIDGTRLKIKGEEYCRIHRIVSDVTPLGIWRVMAEKENWREELEETRQLLPEEFWGDFDEICKILSNNVDELCAEVLSFYRRTCEMTDKEIGLTVKAAERRWIFPLRKSRGLIELGGRLWKMIMEEVRPTGNQLAGYRSSSAMTRVLNE